MRSRLTDGGLVLAYAGLIFFLSAQSTFPAVLQPIWTFDKVVHCVEYSVLAFLIARLLRPWPHAALGAVMLASLYGVSDEVHQYFVPGRSSDRFDALADAAGATLGAAAFALHRRLRSRVKRGT